MSITLTPEDSLFEDLYTEKEVPKSEIVKQVESSTKKLLSEIDDLSLEQKERLKSYLEETIKKAKKDIL